MLPKLCMDCFKRDEEAVRPCDCTLGYCHCELGEWLTENPTATPKQIDEKINELDMPCEDCEMKGRNDSNAPVPVFQTGCYTTTMGLDLYKSNADVLSARYYCHCELGEWLTENPTATPKQIDEKINELDMQCEDCEMKGRMHLPAATSIIIEETQQEVTGSIWATLPLDDDALEVPEGDTPRPRWVKLYDGKTHRFNVSRDGFLPFSEDCTQCRGTGEVTGLMYRHECAECSACTGTMQGNLAEETPTQREIDTTLRKKDFELWNFGKIGAYVAGVDVPDYLRDIKPRVTWAGARNLAHVLMVECIEGYRFNEIFSGVNLYGETHYCTKCGEGGSDADKCTKELNTCERCGHVRKRGSWDDNCFECGNTGSITWRDCGHTGDDWKVLVNKYDEYLELIDTMRGQCERVVCATPFCV